MSREVILPRAVAASLLLHGFAFLVLVSVNLSPGAGTQAPPAVRADGILITLVRRSERAGSDAENMPAAPITPEENQPETAVPDPGRVVVESETTDVAPVPVTQAPDESPGDEAAVTGRAETLALVSTAITGYREARQVDLHREYVEGCIRQRNRYGPTADCPDGFAEDYRGNARERQLADELFATVTRDADYARLRYKLERENELLQEIMAAGGPAGEQAEIRWRLNRQYHAYLSDNILPELTFRSQTAFVNDYNRTIIPAPYQAECRDGPCIYKYTGFTVKRPENYVERPPSFVIRAPLFKPSKD